MKGQKGNANSCKSKDIFFLILNINEKIKRQIYRIVSNFYTQREKEYTIIQIFFNEIVTILGVAFLKFFFFNFLLPFFIPEMKSNGMGENTILNL